MSARESVDTRARLLTYARWAAIGLACLAALILAVASGAAALRIAAFLAVVAVVLVVLSITLNGASSTKLHLEEVLLDEIDMLRDDVRADITTAARATHRALAERVSHLHENIEQVRRQVDERALGEVRAPRPAVAAAPPRRAIAGAGVPVVHTETVHVTTQTYVDPVDDPRGANFVRPSTRRPDRSDRSDHDQYAEPARPEANRGEGRGGVPRGDAGRADIGRSDAGRSDYGADRLRARDTYPADPPARRGGDDRPGYADHPDTPGAGRSLPREPREDSWAEQRLREFVTPRNGDAYEQDGYAHGHDADWRHDRDDDPADDSRWSGMRSGDRWAEVRTDERGRELRMGERRTAVRADETGTQMRIVDRWSSVRQEHGAYPGDDGHADRGYDGDVPSGQHPSGQHGRTGSDDGRGSRFRGGSDNTGETRGERRRREEAEGRSGGDGHGRRSGTGPDEGHWGSSERYRPALPAAEPSSGRDRSRSDGGHSDQRDDDRWGRSRPDADRSESSRSRREISGEVVRRSDHEAGTPSSRSDHGWSEPHRSAVDAQPAHRDSHASHARQSDRHQAPDTGQPGYHHADQWAAESRQSEPRRSDSRRDDSRRDDSRRDDQRRDDSRRDDGGWSRDGRDSHAHGDGRWGGGEASDRHSESSRHGGDRDDNRWEREPSGSRSSVRRRLEFDGDDSRWQ